MPDAEKAQLDRFKDAAREIGADESDDALDRAFGKLKLKRPSDSEADEKEPKGD